MAMKQIKNMFAPESTALLKEMVDLKDSQIDLNTSLTDLFNQVVRNAYPLNNVLSEQIGLKGFTETETEIARCIDFTGLLSKNSTVLSRFSDMVKEIAVSKPMFTRFIRDHIKNAVVLYDQRFGTQNSKRKNMTRLMVVG